MSETNPSLVSSELTTIETFKDTTEKRRSTLTLNELNYISDKQLHKKDNGGESGGDSEDSPVKAADVRFVTDDTMYSGYLDNVFPNTNVFIYYPGGEDHPAAVFDLDFRRNITAWNDNMEDDEYRLVAPQVFGIAGDNFNVSVVSGSAEIIEIDDGSVLYITGDCEIEISVISSDH